MVIALTLPKSIAVQLVRLSRHRTSGGLSSRIGSASQGPNPPNPHTRRELVGPCQPGLDLRTPPRPRRGTTNGLHRVHSTPSPSGSVGGARPRTTHRREMLPHRPHMLAPARHRPRGRRGTARDPPSAAKTMTTRHMVPASVAQCEQCLEYPFREVFALAPFPYEDVGECAGFITLLFVLLRFSEPGITHSP